MIIWNGETLVDVSEGVAEEMIANGEAVSVGPFDGLRIFPTRAEMLAAVPVARSIGCDRVNEYATKEMIPGQAPRRRGRPPGSKNVKAE